MTAALPCSAKTLRYTADLVARGEDPLPLHLSLALGIAAHGAAARGDLADPDAVVAALEESLLAHEATLNAELRQRSLVLAMHLRAAASKLDVREAAHRRCDERFERSIGQLEVRAIEQGFDPRGWFVYTLWGRDDVRPLYVGMSGNVLSRLGSHASNPDRRYLIERVTLIRCRTEERARSLEGRLIRKHRPPLNVAGVGS